MVEHLTDQVGWTILKMASPVCLHCSGAFSGYKVAYSYNLLQLCVTTTIYKVGGSYVLCSNMTSHFDCY